MIAVIDKQLYEAEDRKAGPVLFACLSAMWVFAASL